MMLKDEHQMRRAAGRNQDKRDIAKQRITVIGSNEQVGIAKAILSLVTHAKTKHVLFLEEDFTLEFAQDTYNELLESLDLLRSNQVDLVKLRHRQAPGVPFCSLNKWHGKEDELKQMITATSNTNLFINKENDSPIKSDNTFSRLSILNTMHWIKHPDIFYPNNIIWKCKTERNENSFYCTNSMYAGWTNNPTMFQKEWFLKHFKSIAENDFTGRLEAAINLTPQAWIWQCFVIGQGNGLFTHNDLDKPLHLQSPC